jgi:hypothetical protein
MNRHPKLDYVKECLMLLGDICCFYPTELMKHTSSALLMDRTAILIKFNKDGHLSQTISYVKQQFRLPV